MAISGGGTPEGEMSVTSGKYVSDKNLKYFWSKLKTHSNPLRVFLIYLFFFV